jgi:hypothetical protein
MLKGKGDGLMRSVWNDIKNHRLALALFMAWWVALVLLNFVVSRRTQESVAQLYFGPPAIAGALVCWWRRSRPDRITSGTLAGATVFVLEFAPMLPRDFIAALARGKGLLEALKVLFDVEALAIGALSCVLGAVLGFLAALAVVVFAYLEKRWPSAVPDSQSASSSPRSVTAEPVDKASAISGRRIMPRPRLAVAGGLVLLATLILAPVAYGRAAPPPPPFTAVNVLVAIALLAPISRWSDDAGTALVLIAGLVSFSVGAALLVGAGFTWATTPAMLSVAMSAGALAELGAGVLALSTFRKSDAHLCSVTANTT